MKTWNMFLVIALFFSNMLFGQTIIEDYAPTIKLKSYIKKIEKQTNHKVTFKRDYSLFKGIPAGFRVDSCCIRIMLAKDFAVTDPYFEELIAHELTHGLLICSMNYYEIKPFDNINEDEANALSLVGTIIQDIVVNRLLQKKGFEPTPRNIYLTTTKNEIEAAMVGANVYPYNPNFRRKFIVFRYILAWSSLEYFTLDKELNENLRALIKVFEKTYPDECVDAHEIKKIILTHNIFTSRGYNEAVKSLLKFWKLTHLVQKLS
jgi:hypothetical protein